MDDGVSKFLVVAPGDSRKEDIASPILTSSDVVMQILSVTRKQTTLKALKTNTTSNSTLFRLTVQAGSTEGSAREYSMVRLPERLLGLGICQPLAATW